MAGGTVTAEAHLQADPALAQTHRKIQRHARGIVISGYDLTKRCNLRCEGCFFFEGDRNTVYPEEKSDGDYDAFFGAEVLRGVNYPHFAGAEPALVQERLRIAAGHWRRGLVYTNGTVRLDPAIPFMIHVSLWGAPETDAFLRGAPVFRKAVQHYAGDERAVVMMTVSRRNVDDIPIVARACADAGLKLSFNHFSPSREYARKVAAEAAHDQRGTFRFSTRSDNLIFAAEDLARVRDAIAEAMARWSETVIYSSYYNDWINDPQPRFDIDRGTGMATDCPILNMNHHRQYHVDFSYRDDECCIANIDCTGCRHYVSGYTKIMAGRREHLDSLERFRGWVEVFDTWCRLHFVGWDRLV